MHGKIFQITKEKYNESAWISSDDYYDHWFVGAIADYVSDDVDRKECIEWLKTSLNGAINIRGNILTIVDKGKYFERKFAEFREQLDALTKISAEQFMGNEPSDIDMTVYRLKEAYDDKYGYYVDDCGEWGGLGTFDDFMRRSTNGERYYIGGIVDYHF